MLTDTFRFDCRLNGRRETLTIGGYGPSGILLLMARKKTDRRQEGRRPGQIPSAAL